ncbi:MAG TPA: hypothetical protein VJC21_01695 [Candidatus Nanoarchaeia archaeon]|nr:hypothetical protein [Nanoarchaeota archaeon]HLC97475.1 hypothetical protein [Candidatus Nanoarchaeia archaeon]
MSEAAVMAHMHADLEELKQDIAIVKHILSEEGKVTVHAQKMLAEARATPDSQYIRHEDLKRRILR